MKTLVVYDSFFGNTEKLAKAIGDSLNTAGSVKTLKVSEVKPDHLAGVQLLIVGSPTRGFRPTKAIVTFLKQLPADALKGVKVLAFDTRMDTAEVKSAILNVFVKLFGYAAEPIAKHLQKKGGALALPPEGFFVKDSEGPLRDGEVERAQKWAKIS